MIVKSSRSFQTSELSSKSIQNLDETLNNKQPLSSNCLNSNQVPKKMEDTPLSPFDSVLNENSQNEIKDLKNKLKIMTNKFQQSKKEKDQFQKENKSLQEEVLTLQSNLRQMIPGFSNTSSSFPMLNELSNQTNEFYKYDCIDIFFDLLCPELNMKGIIYFFLTAYSKVSDIIANYFLPLENTIKKTGCLNSIEGPIMNVLRKSFQTNYKEMIKKLSFTMNTDEIVDEIQNNLKLGNFSEETTKLIKTFLTKLSEFLICYYICDPPLIVNYKNIGNKVLFNATKHDPLDGFIKAKEECIVILPSLHKNSSEGELIGKGLVLQVNYEIPN